MFGKARMVSENQTKLRFFELGDLIGSLMEKESGGHVEPTLLTKTKS